MELKELKKTQQEIDNMSDEELNILNNDIRNYASEKCAKIKEKIRLRLDIILYAVKRYKQLLYLVIMNKNLFHIFIKR